MLEIVTDRQRTEVYRAIVTFVTRRSYRMTSPWYVDGLRIEAPPHEGRLLAEGLTDQIGSLIRGPHRRSWWATLLDIPQVPRIDLEIKRRLGRTVVKIKISSHRDSVKLAAQLQGHLLEDQAYDAQSPSNCPACGAPIPHVIARYCGRCGRAWVGTKADAPRLSSGARAADPQRASTSPMRLSAGAKPVEIVAPIEVAQLEEAADAAPADAAIAPATPAAKDEEPDPVRDALDVGEPDTATPVVPGPVAEDEPPPAEEPAVEAMAEADDDPEPPRRALAED